MEAYWAHNPEVRGSKPRSANLFFLLPILLYIVYKTKRQVVRMNSVQYDKSRVAQWKRAGLVTKRSEDRNLALAFSIYYFVFQCIHLISRVRGPYGKLWTEFFPSFYGPSAKRAGHENKEGKNEDP